MVYKTRYFQIFYAYILQDSTHIKSWVFLDRRKIGQRWEVYFLAKSDPWRYSHWDRWWISSIVKATGGLVRWKLAKVSSHSCKQQARKQVRYDKLNFQSNAWLEFLRCVYHWFNDSLVYKRIHVKQTYLYTLQLNIKDIVRWGFRILSNFRTPWFLPYKKRLNILPYNTNFSFSS